MSDYRGTFGATQNEGSRHGGGGGDSWGPETYGVTQNESGRRGGRGQQGGGGDDYVPSTTGASGQPAWNGHHQPNGHAGTYGTAGNEPPRHQDDDNGGYHPYTYGPGGNEPSRHRDTLTKIFVKNPTHGGSSPMHVNLDTMSQDELVRRIACDLGMNAGQLFVNLQGKPLSGPGSLRGAGLYKECTVIANGRLRGG